MKRLLIPLFFATLLFSCVSYPTAVPPANTFVVEELGGVVKISSIQYEYTNVGVGNNRYVFPIDKTKRITILSIQPQGINRNNEYDLSNITLENENGIAKPIAVRYFEGNSAMGTSDWGFVEALNIPLIVKFRKSGKYTLLLFYSSNPEERYNRIGIFNKTIDIDTTTSMKESFIDSFKEKY